MDFTPGDTVIRIDSANGRGAKVGQKAKVIGMVDGLVAVSYRGCLKEFGKYELWAPCFTSRKEGTHHASPD